VSASDKAAVRAAVDATSKDLLNYLVRRVPSAEDAADLYGQTMLIAWEKITKFPREPERQRMWLFVIAANTLSNHRRSSQRRLVLADRLREVVAATEMSPPVEGAYAVRDAVLRLHEAQRELVMLIHWDGFNIVEAAEILGLNPSTARSRYAAARQTLRKALIDART